VVAFDDGDILGGLGHMAEGAAQTIGGAVEHGVEGLGSAVSDLFGSDGSGPADAGQGTAPDAGAAAQDAGAGYDAGASYDPSAEAAMDGGS
jgi:hypothetical protein